jgi:hypothetical protein
MGEDLFLEVRGSFDSLEILVWKKQRFARADRGKHM